MKLKFIYTIFTISVVALLFMSHSDGRAGSQNAGNTGAPGDEMIGPNAKVCANCHDGNAIETIMSIEVLDETGTVVADYVPNQTYRVRVAHDVVTNTAQGYGFQLLCLEAPMGIDGPDAAAFSNPAANVQIEETTSNNRQYAEHNGVSSSEFFEVDWTAPEVGTGAVTFYSCGNAVNDNNMTSGDGSNCVVLELAEGNPSSTTEVDGGVKIFLFPNPVQEVMKVRLLSDLSAEFNMEVFDMQGRLVISETIAFMAGENNFVYDVNDLSRGAYLVKFSNKEKIATAKLLKF